MVMGALTAPLDGAFVPAPVSGVEAVDADGEIVLVDEVTDRLHLLNRTAALVWQCFDGEASVAEIAFDLADGLGVPFEQILGDTLAIVADLVAQGVCSDGRAGSPDRSFDIPRRSRLLDEPPSD